MSSDGFCAAMRVRLERRKDGVPVVFPTPSPSSDETGKAVISSDTVSKGRASSAKEAGKGKGKGKSKGKRNGKEKNSNRSSSTDEWAVEGDGGANDPYSFLTIAMMDVLEAGWCCWRERDGGGKEKRGR